MSLQQLMSLLRARWKLALVTWLGVVASTVAISLLIPEQYTASTSVLVDVKSPDPIVGITLPALVMPGYMATQVAIVNSDRVAQKVVALLKLAENPEARERWLNDTNGKGTIEVWLWQSLQKRLDVKPSRESNVININYKAVDPKFAAEIANAFAKAYIDTTVDLRAEPARQYADWFDDQGKTLRQNLEKAQARLSAYQQEHGIVAPDERLDTETAKLNELSAQLTVAHSQTMEARSKQGAPDTLPDYLQSITVQRLKDRIAEQHAKLEALGRNVGGNHPDYQRLQSEIASLDAALAVEKRQIDASFAAASGVGKGREAALRQAVEAQKRNSCRLGEQGTTLPFLPATSRRRTKH